MENHHAFPMRRSDYRQDFVSVSDKNKSFLPVSARIVSNSTLLF
jgi:hypothetical protein